MTAQATEELVQQPALVADLATLEARAVSAWFGDHKVLDRVSLTMPAGQVTALIGPSGCGKSTFLRILNRMHELGAVGASWPARCCSTATTSTPPAAGSPTPAGAIGMVFQKPNPFPAMSISDNVVAGLKLTGVRARPVRPKDRARRGVPDARPVCGARSGTGCDQPGGALSGGQQQRLCIARSLAVARGCC